MTASVQFTTAETGAEAPKPAEQPKPGEQGTPAPAATERPAWLPEQFKSPEDLAKSYAEAQAELTRMKQAASKPAEQPKPEEPKPGEQPKAEEPKPGEQPKTPEEAAKQAVQNAGLDVSTWQTEFNQTGDVSAEGRAKIAEALKGQFGDNAAQMVNDFIEGQKMRVANYRQQGTAIVGGDEQYAQMMAWASSALSAAEQETYNKAVDSFDVNAMQLAVNGLKSKYEAANGVQPKLVSTENGIPNSQVGFASTFEMTQAMSDPRYGKDPVYTKAIEQRAMRSNF